MSTTMFEKLIATNTNFDVAAARAEIERIADIPFHSFIDDTDALAVALYADDVARCSDYLDNPPSDAVHQAAVIARDLHLCEALRNAAIEMDYFSKVLPQLLAIASICHDNAARLAPVFVRFYNMDQEHKIGPHLCDVMEQCLHQLVEQDHFLILALDRGQIYERFFV